LIGPGSWLVVDETVEVVVEAVADLGASAEAIAVVRA
jgi:hypothetical protein